MGRRMRARLVMMKLEVWLNVGSVYLLGAPGEKLRNLSVARDARHGTRRTMPAH